MITYEEIARRYNLNEDQLLAFMDCFSNDDSFGDRKIREIAQDLLKEFAGITFDETKN